MGDLTLGDLTLGDLTLGDLTPNSRGPTVFPSAPTVECKKVKRLKRLCNAGCSEVKLSTPAYLIRYTDVAKFPHFLRSSERRGER